MMSRRTIVLLLTGVILLAGLVLHQSSVNAKTSPRKGAFHQIKLQVLFRTGTVKITQPDGREIIVKKGQPLPLIPSGSQITVLSGVLLLQMGETLVNIEKAESVLIAINEAGAGVLTAMIGEIEVITANKEKKVLSRGTSLNTATGETKIPEVGEEVLVSEAEPAESEASADSP